MNNLGLWAGTDPCSGANPEYTAAQCALTGVTAAQYGSVVQSPADQYNQVTGGNVNLDVEEADTITVGVVFTPTDNLTVSLDYWNIEIEDTIATVGSENIVRQCATNGVLCDSITRGPTGNLWQGEIRLASSTGTAKRRYRHTLGKVSTWQDPGRLDALGGTFGVNLA